MDLFVLANPFYPLFVCRIILFCTPIRVKKIIIIILLKYEICKD